jgi:type IV pilus assembly protein PilX
MKSTRIRFPSRQSGAVMVVSLLLLLVMTVLALAASQSTRMQEKMAGNSRDHDLALQSAEAGLRAGEAAIVALTKIAPFCTTAPCKGKIYETSVIDKMNVKALAELNDSWWQTNATQYAAAKTIGGTGLAYQDPTFVVEHIEEVLTSPEVRVPPTFISNFRVTSRGVGGSTNSVVVLQSTWAVKLNN